MSKSIRLLVVLSIFLSQKSYAQLPPVLKYGPRDGVGHSIVYNIFQDKKGFLWFSTDNGITRYDGHDFVNYTAEDGLRSNFVFDVIENDTAMLISSFGAGIVSYNRSQTFSLSPLMDSVLYPLELVQYKNVLWIVDRWRRLYCYKNQTFYSSGINCHSILPSSKGLLMLSKNVSRYDSASDSFVEVKLKNIPERVFSAIELKDHTFLITSESWVYHVDFEKQISVPFLAGTFRHQYRPFFQDVDENIWVTDLTGKLWLISPDLKSIELLWTDVALNDIFQDRDRNIWLATRGQGVWCMPTPYVRNYLKKGLVSPSFVFDPNLGKVVVNSLNTSSYALEESTHYTSVDIPEIYKTRNISHVYSTNDGDILVGSHDAVFRLRNSKIDSMRFGYVQSSMYKSSADVYWAGMRMGLCRISSDFKSYDCVPLFKERIVRSLSEKKDGLILVGTDKGLYEQTKNGGWICYGEKQGLTNTYVNVVVYDSLRGGHWIGTNEGVFFLNEHKRIISFINSYTKMRCNAIVPSAGGLLWVGTTNGLVVYDGQSFRRFRSEEGIPDDVYGLIYANATDRLYVLSAEGVSVVQVKKFLGEERVAAPSIVVTQQMSGGLHLMNATDVAIIPDDASDLLLGFSILTFKNAERWQAYYRVNGGDWIYTNERKLNFLNLSPGLFTIDFQARDNNGNHSSVRRYKYFVTAPFYRQKWFLNATAISLIIATVLTTIMITRWLYARKNRKLTEIQQRIELEQKAFSNMLNPHFLNNALNSIQAFVTSNDQRKTLSYISKFARLMRGTLELLANSTVTVGSELGNIRLYLEFEKLRFGDKLFYTIDVDTSINQSLLKIPSMIIQPFVENSIWHGILPKGEPGTISISIIRQEKQLIIRIEDDGIGLRRSLASKGNARRKSMGLTIIEKRLKLFDEKYYQFNIYDRADVYPGSNGTVVEIKLPVRY